MSYLFTAKPILRDAPVVHLINGRMVQSGLPWQEDDPGWSRCRDVAESVAEQALLDVGYCLDAPIILPAGGCEGDAIDNEFAVAFQLMVRR